MRRWELSRNPGERLYREALDVRLGRATFPPALRDFLEAVHARLGVAAVHAALVDGEPGRPDLAVLTANHDDLDRFLARPERSTLQALFPEPSRALRADHVEWYAGKDAFDRLRKADPGYRDAVQAGIRAEGFRNLGGDGPHHILFFDRNAQARAAETGELFDRLRTEFYRRAKPHDLPDWLSLRGVTLSTQTKEQWDQAESVGRV